MKVACASWVVWVALAAVGCGSDDGETEGEKLDPGRDVSGCFDCTADEYCMMIDTEAAADQNFCAPNSCGDDCGCLMDDAAKRHDECSSSCQDGSGLVYCAR
jgi:hypothetical protein